MYDNSSIGQSYRNAYTEHAAFQAAQNVRFDFTLLFEQTILSILPSAIFLLCTPLRLYRLQRATVKTLPDPILSVKAVTAAVYAALQLFLLVLWSKGTSPENRASVPAAILMFINALAILILSYAEHKRSVRPSSLLNIYLLFSLIFDAAQCRTLYLDGVKSLVSGVFTAGMGVKAVLLFLEAQSKMSYLRYPYRDYSPETISGVFNRSLFLWLNRLFRMGFRSLLAPTDLLTIDNKFKSEPLGTRMRQSWEHRAKPEGIFTLPRVIISCFKWELFTIAYYRLLLIGFNYAQPFLINRAIKYLSQPETPKSRNIGYGLIAATFLIYTGLSLITMLYTHNYYRTATMFRGGMISLIYERTLTLQDGACSESAAVTLMSTDIDRIVSSIQKANDIWASSIEVVIGVWLLERQLGAVCVIPLVLVGIGVLGQSWVAKHIGGRQKRWNEAVQHRVAATSSVLGSMKAAKMMGLSETMFKLLQNLRIDELHYCALWMQLIIVMNFISNVMADWAPVLTFITYVLIANARGTADLSTAQAFTSLAIISLVTKPAVAFIQAIPQLASSMGNFARLQDYLLSEPVRDERVGPELQNPFTTTLRHSHEDNSGIELFTIRPKTAPSYVSDAISLDAITVCPAQNAPPAVIDVSFSALKGDLTIIVGPIGSGKTTLLKAILGETAFKPGSVTVSSKRMAYCSQTPWVLNTSMQQAICGLNIDLVIDERWYQKVLHACALDDDIKHLPDGDLSIVGSKGLTLSGGQKQRLALACAVYARQDIILLDDVISALDSKTEEMVVTRLFGKKGILKSLGTTIILVTHATRRLPLADKIIVLSSEGRVSQQGTYEQLRSESGFVRGLSFEERRVAGDLKGNQKPHDASTTTRSAQGPTQEQIQDLSRRTGDFSIYRYYFRSIKKSSSIYFISSNVIYAFCYGYLQVWLQRFTTRDSSTALFITIYALLAFFADAALTATLAACFLRMLPESAANLHETLLKTTMTAPQRFFAETDTGVTLNRFSQDMSLVDSQLPTAVLVTTTDFFGALVQVALICSGSSWMAITVPVLLLVVYFIQDIYLKTSRQLRFMDLEAKSPVYSHFLETLDGLPIIRAFGWQESAIKAHLVRLDASQRPYYLLFCIQRWLSLVMDLLVAGMAVTVVALAVELRSSTTAGLLGVALNNVLTFNSTLSNLITEWTSLETSLGAISRVRSFESTTISEQLPEECQTPPDDWPTRGAIQFQDLSATYGDEALVLNNINMDIAPGQRVGICGRTGSGKSSLLLTLLRLLDMHSGTITIDGLDLRTIPRSDIRSRLIAIPQDPFMLLGSVRLNADPSGAVSDEIITGALIKIGLWSLLESRGGLDANMQEQPLSHGQQQLFCLARAMLRKGRVLILDEATSNVDSETDKSMQRIIREEFGNHTIITVAHRLDTIIDSDKIAVLDHGRLIEFDSPASLLARDSEFKQLYGGV